MAETRSFTRASERLHIVQSAASASIRTLELDLQAELFTRTTQRVALTEAGRCYCPRRGGFSPRSNPLASWRPTSAVAFAAP